MFKDDVNQIIWCVHPGGHVTVSDIEPVVGVLPTPVSWFQFNTALSS